MCPIFVDLKSLDSTSGVYEGSILIMLDFLILDDKMVQRFDIDEVLLDHICGSVVQRFDIDRAKF